MDAETPVDGATLFENFLKAVPWEDPEEEMMVEVKKILKANWVTRVSHFGNLDVKSMKLPADDAPAGASLGDLHRYGCFADLFPCMDSGFIQKACNFFEEQYGTDDEKEVAAPKTPKRDDTASSRVEAALLSFAEMGKTRKVYEQINLEELMETHGLDWYFPPEASCACLGVFVFCCLRCK